MAFRVKPTFVWEKCGCLWCFEEKMTKILGDKIWEYFDKCKDGGRSYYFKHDLSREKMDEYFELTKEAVQLSLEVRGEDGFSNYLCLDCLLEAIQNYPEPINVDKAIVQKWLDEH